MGHQQVSWSKGLRKLLLDGEPEKSDEEIAAEDIGGEVVALITRDDWRVVTRTPGLPAAVLDAAERGPRQLRRVLARTASHSPREGLAREQAQQETPEGSSRKKRQARKTVLVENGLVDVQSYAELVELADRGETLECDCDAHQLLHDMPGIDVPPVSQ